MLRISRIARIESVSSAKSAAFLHMKRFVFLILVFTMFAGVAAAQSEITLLAPGPLRTPIDKIVANFQAKGTYKVKVTYGTGLSTRQSIAKGEPLDVTLAVAPYYGAIASGSVDPKSATPVTSFLMAVAVPKNAAKPDISTPAAVKKALLSAKSVGFVDPDFGSAGQGATEAISKLGIFDQIATKSKVPNGGGPVQRGLESGELEIGMLYLSDMLPNNKITIVGVLPKEICTPTAIVGFISKKANDPQGATALLQYLASAEAQAIFKQAGFQPQLNITWDSLRH
jgi:molybdate transport system substrate-binding protein